MYSRSQDYSRSNETLNSSVSLLILTACYFVVEIIINYTIYTQLSVGSDQLTIEVMEVWGRAVTGIGMALILSKLYFANKYLHTSQHFNEAPKNAVAVFIICCLVSVPFSFWLQGKIIDTIVERSTGSQRNSAILILATKSTLVPYYDISLASYSTGKLKIGLFDKALYPIKGKERATSYHYIVNEKLFMSVAGECVKASQEALGVTKRTDKAFFAYTELLSGTKEKPMLSLLSDYYTCLYQNKEYLKSHKGDFGYPRAPIEQMYNDKYKPASDKYMAALRSIGVKGITIGVINTQWVQGVDRELGFKSDIKPNLSLEGFASDPDIKREYLSHIKNADSALYPFNEDFDDGMRGKILDSLPAAAIPSYKNDAGELIGGNSADDEQKVIEDGRRAYKAIVIPIIGLAMSAFFLLSNIIVSMSLMVARSTTARAGMTVFSVLVIWVFIYPYFSAMIGDSAIGLSEQSYAIKWLYYNENILSKLYQLFI